MIPPSRGALGPASNLANDAECGMCTRRGATQLELGMKFLQDTNFGLSCAKLSSRIISKGGKMSAYSVDPDKVIGVLSAVDSAGEGLETAATAWTTLLAEVNSALIVQGRTTVSAAWASFTSDRSRVPGQFITLYGTYVSQVAKATEEVILGDLTMFTTVEAAQKHAEESWDILGYQEYAY